MSMFGDDVAAGLAELREHAVSNMRDACVIERRTGRVLDEATLEYTDAWVEVYAGRCRVKVKGTQPAESEPGGRTFVVNDAISVVNCLTLALTTPLASAPVLYNST